jgi:hypothetical protein
MIRLSVCLVVAAFVLSACESAPITSPMESEVPDLTLDRADLTLFEVPDGCPVSDCLFGPYDLMRETGEPTVRTKVFTGADGQEATLVVLASRPKTTTIRVWLNEETVLLPSDLPRSGSNEVRVPVTLQDDNTLKIRLSAKPGTQVWVWVEGDDDETTDEGSLPAAVEFALSGSSYGPTEDKSEACSGIGDGGFSIADWTDVVEAVTGGAAKEDILGSGSALVLNNGVATFTIGGVFTPLQTRHYAISAFEPSSWIEASVGTEMFWLTSTTDLKPVLCIRPAA